MLPMNPHRCALSDPSTLVHIPGAAGYGLKVQRASSRMPYPCALSIPYSTVSSCASTGLDLESRGAVYRCPVRRAHGHILHGVNHPLGPVHQPPSSLALDRDPVGPPDGECGERGCGPTPPRVHSGLALNARAGLRPVLAVRPGGRASGVR